MNTQEETIIGIDLGTTNSEVAFVENGEVVLLKIDGSRIVPSVVSLNEQNEVLVGRVAANNEMAYPEHTIRRIKRKMGSDEIIPLGGCDYTPPMISGLILKRLKLAAEKHLGRSIHKAVITVPAFFNDREREATKEAAAFAGLEVARLLNEPTAAALAYSLNKKAKEMCLIYDLGGGTFDVSIVYTSPEVMEVKASHGDVALGGSDVDLLLAEKMRQEFLKLHEIDLAADLLSWTRLLHASEQAKIYLSSNSSARIVEEFIATKEGIPLHLNYTCLRTELEELVRPLLERTLTSVRMALQMAEISAEQLDRVILVGGMTHMPLVATLLEEELQIAPQMWIDPATVVARGAAIEASTLAGQSLAPYFVDITPHSLGTTCLGDYDLPHNFILIRRNSTIPCTASHIFYKLFKEQDAVKVEVHQGEHTQIEKNTCLGEFLLDGLKDSPGREIHIKFNLDRSGVLHVTASDVATGKTEQRRLKKMANLCKKTVDLTHLESIRLNVDSSEMEMDDANEDWEVDVAPLSASLSLDGDALFSKVEHLLNRATLAQNDREELIDAFEKAKKGDAKERERLSALVYFLE